MNVMIKPVTFVAAAVLMDRYDRVLVGQRPANKAYGGLWEFPGGKLEPGETPEQTLRRELREELGIEIDLKQTWPFTFVSYEGVVMMVYIVRKWLGEPVQLEHSRLSWVEIDRLDYTKMPPADLPVIEALNNKYFW